MIQGNDPVSTGNALKDGTRGWFVGNFVLPTLGLAQQQALEIKWGQHAKGEQRQRFAHSRHATTVAILVSGTFITRLKLPLGLREILLAAPGDYVAFGPGIDHSWEALAASLVITVRFPSVKDDQVTAPRPSEA